MATMSYALTSNMPLSNSMKNFKPSCESNSLAMTSKTSSSKGTKTSLRFVLFHKRICGPLANSLFQFRPSLQGHFKSKLEAAYHKTDKAIQNTIDLLAA